MSESHIALQTVQTRITSACQKTGRLTQSVQLVAVSKTFDAAEIEPVLEAGQRVFGENRVQEAQKKWPELKQKYPDVELHLIGPLQTNKVAEAVALFDVIETVDRPKLASALAREIAKQGAKTRLLIQVNTGRESQKAGVLPEDCAAFLASCRTELGEHLIGLMCIPPVDQDPRPHFQMLKNMAAVAQLHVLSMGMSADFEIAIAEGASHVRVGSAIFGTRPRPISV